MNNTLQYKEFTATYQYSEEDKVYYGKLDGIADLVSFEGETEHGLQRAFHEAVEDYLETRKELEKE